MALPECLSDCEPLPLLASLQYLPLLQYLGARNPLPGRPGDCGPAAVGLYEQLDRQALIEWQVTVLPSPPPPRCALAWPVVATDRWSTWMLLFLLLLANKEAVACACNQLCQGPSGVLAGTRTTVIRLFV